MKTIIHLALALLSIAAISMPSQDAHAFLNFRCGTFHPFIAATSAAAFGTTTMLLTPIIGQAVDEVMGTDNYDMALGYLLTMGGVATATVASTVFVSIYDGCGDTFGSNHPAYVVGVPALATVLGGLVMQPLVRKLSSKKHNTQFVLSPVFDQNTTLNGAQGGLVISF